MQLLYAKNTQHAALCLIIKLEGIVGKITKRLPL